MNTHKLSYACLLSLPLGCFSPNAPEESGPGTDQSGDESLGSDSTDDEPHSTGSDEASEAGSGDGSGSASDAEDSTTGEAECGNAEVEGDEVCDDGTNDGSYGGCMQGCAELGPHCGDGVVQDGDGELCDDGNIVDDETCPSTCGLPGGTVLWEQVYDPEPPGGASSDSAVSVVAMADGGFVVSGVLHATFVGGAAHPGFINQWEGVGWIRRYSSVGATLWNELIDLADGSAASGRDNVVAVASDGARVFAAVASYELPNGSLYAYQAEEGVFEYSRDFTGYGLLGRSDGGYLAAGSYGDDVLRAYDENGTEIWSDNLAEAIDLCVDVVASGDGTIYAVCAEGVHEYDQSDIVLVKLSANGESAWAEGQASLARGSAVAATPDGGVVLLGESNGNVLVSKFTGEGSLEWTHSYGEADVEGEWASAMAVLPGGDVVWTGYDQPPIGGDGLPAWDAYMQRVDQAGEPVWAIRTSAGSLGANVISELDVTPDGSIVAVGWTINDETDSSAVWLARISP